MLRSLVARNLASIRNRRRSTAFLATSLLCALLTTTVALAQPQHTDPLNLDPRVHDAQQHFYNLDYEGALSRFEAIERDHPHSAMAVDYVLTIVIFRELYNQDLLDTTYYAHDNFLTTRRTVNVAPA